MSSITTITIADGKGTPENHVYTPIQAGNKMTYRTTLSALPLIGQERISNEVSEVNANLQMVTLVLELPALETATDANSQGYTAAPKVGYTNKAKVMFYLPTRGDSAQRKDLRVLLKNLLADAQIIDLVDNLISAH